MKLPDLFRKIQAYYQQAVSGHLISKYGQGYYMPDEEEAPTTPIDNSRYTELFQAAQQVNDPSLSSELQLIAEMYRKAIEIGGGYNSINRAISNIINMYLEDEDDPQQAAIEDLLNEVVKDLRYRAGGQAALNRPDPPTVMAQLKKFKDDYNNRAVQDEIDDLSQYEEKAVPTFDPTGGVGREEAQKGTGRGYYVKTVKSLKDWVEHYRNEQQRYHETMTQSTNTALKDKAAKLLEVLGPLVGKYTEANKLQTELTNNPDPGKQAQLQGLMQEIKTLKTERSKLKGSLRRDLLQEERDNLANSLRTAPAGSRAQDLLIWQLELNKLLESRDKNKGEEVKLRRMLIAGMSGGNTLGLDTLKKLLEKIKEAAALKIPVETVRKEEAAKIKEQFEYEMGGGKIRPEKRVKAKTWEGLLIDLGSKLSTQKIVIKQLETDRIRKEKHLFKPLLDMESEAKNKLEYAKNKLKNAEQSGNDQTINSAKQAVESAESALKISVKELSKTLNNYAENQPAVKTYTEIARHFYNFRTQANLIGQSNIMDMDNASTISYELGNLIKNAIQEGYDIIEVLKRFGDFKRYDTIIKATLAIINKLENRIRLTKQAAIYKIAQESFQSGAEHYRNEWDSYFKEYNKTTNPFIKTKLVSILEILRKLVSVLNTSHKIQQELITDPTDDTKRDQLRQIKEEVEDLKKERTRQRQILRRDLLEIQRDELDYELKTTPGDVKSKLLLEQKLELTKLLSSRDQNKEEEIKLRKLLLSYLSKGNNVIDPNIFSNLLKKIQEASSKKIPIEDIRKEEAGTIKEVKESGTLRGATILFGQNINTQRRELKRKLYPILRSEFRGDFHKGLSSNEIATFNPYFSAINVAKQNNDYERVAKLIKELNALVSKYANLNPIVIAYNKQSEKLHDYEARLLAATEPGTILSSKELNNLIEIGYNLISNLQKDETLHKTLKIFNPILKNIHSIIALLKDKKEAINE